MNISCGHLAQLAIAASALISFVACGRDDSAPHPVGGTAPTSALNRPHTTAMVGGAVSGLVGQGLTIEMLNRVTVAHRSTVLEQIDIVANGAFTFRLPPSKSYEVIIVHQPHSPTQQCAVRNGQGVIGTADVTDVGIVCGPPV